MFSVRFFWKPLILKLSVIIIVLAFCLTSFAGLEEHNNDIAAQSKSNTSLSPPPQQNINCAGYVKYTLDLLNSTLCHKNNFI
jgi:hypothetical protein